MEHPFNVVLYGGDYNPEQWPKEIWKEDLRLFDLAGINSATVNVFSWAKLQPSEEEYNFAELDEIIDMLSKANIQIVLATSTGAMPAWLVRKYPEVARVDYEGRRHKFGGRHNACPNSPVFQHYAHELAHRLAERYGSNPHVVCWHVSNEYGGACYCENCEKAFRVWLRKRYGTLDALNAAWNTSFWGHTFYDWDDIVAPNALGDGIPSDKTCFAGMSIDYRRFMSDSLLGNFTMERDAIRECDPSTPITTNLMGTYKGLDYFRWAKQMDIVSWDNYPSFDTPWSMTAMNHDLMRSLKGKPFMLMETSGFLRMFITRPIAAAIHWPRMVAYAAPATPIFGTPNRPKMKIGSRMMLAIAPTPWLTIVSSVRPVLCSRRSKRICMKMPIEPSITMVV